ARSAVIESGLPGHNKKSLKGKRRHRGPPPPLVASNARRSRPRHWRPTLMLDFLAPPADINNRYVSGRALKRLALSHTGRVRLAADLASGLRQLHPSLAQTARLVGVAEEDIRTELKARAKTHEAAVPTPVTDSPRP